MTPKERDPFTAFGKDWEIEAMKIDKPILVEMYKQALIKKMLVGQELKRLHLDLIGVN